MRQDEIAESTLFHSQDRNTPMMSSNNKNLFCHYQQLISSEFDNLCFKMESLIYVKSVNTLSNADNRITPNHVDIYSSNSQLPSVS
jgi:hypothetical protein